MDFDRIDRIRKGGHVKRYHTHQCHHPGTVADHSWFVAWLAGELWWDSHQSAEAPASLYRYALEHDLVEFDTGDAPGWAKATWKSMREGLQEVEVKRGMELGLYYSHSDEEIRTVVKAADKLDVLFWALEERRMGNAAITIIFVRTTVSLGKWLRSQEDKDLMRVALKIRNWLTYEMRKLDWHTFESVWDQVQDHEDYYSKLGAPV